MRDFKKLEVWKRTIVFGKIIYDVTKKFPKEEVYSLTSQLRRAATSISSNIAEGCGRRTKKDFIYFLYNAMGSVREVESQLYIIKELRYLENDTLKKLVNEVEEIARMLAGFIKYISGLDINEE